MEAYLYLVPLVGIEPTMGVLPLGYEPSAITNLHTAAFFRADTQNRTGVSSVPRMCNYQLYDNCFLCRYLDSNQDLPPMFWGRASLTQYRNLVPPTGFEPAHSGFKPDTTANYVTGAVCSSSRPYMGSRKIHQMN